MPPLTLSTNASCVLQDLGPAGNELGAPLRYVLTGREIKGGSGPGPITIVLNSRRDSLFRLDSRDRHFFCARFRSARAHLIRRAPSRARPATGSGNCRRRPIASPHRPRRCSASFVVWSSNGRSRHRKSARQKPSLQHLNVTFDAASARVTALEAQRLAETPWVRERVVELYKRRYGGYLRLLHGGRRPAVARPHEPRRRVGRASSIASASTAIAAPFATNARRWPSSQARRGEVDNARAVAAQGATGARPGRQRPQPAARRSRSSAVTSRPVTSASCRSAQAELQKTRGDRRRRRRRRCPLAPFRGSLEWPVAGKLLSRFGRSTAGRFGTAIVRNGIEIGVAERHTGQGGARRHRGLRGAVHGLRHTGHRRSRRRRVHAVRPSD